jgi:molybdopterin-guanine dinucleotide biosynthesis protein A
MPGKMSQVAPAPPDDLGDRLPDQPPRLPAAVVLAGGRSTRMGSDKSLLALSGRPLIAHVLARLRPQARAVAINANGDAARFERFGLPVLADTVEGHRGPLAGLLAGMEWAEALGASHLVGAPTDSPFIPGDLVVRLSEASRQEPGRPALAASAGRTHPVVGLWPVALAGRLRGFLTAGETYKVSAFAGQCGAVAVDFPLIRITGRDIDPFFNVNTPDDLQFAEALLEDMGS